MLLNRHTDASAVAAFDRAIIGPKMCDGHGCDGRWAMAAAKTLETGVNGWTLVMVMVIADDA